MHSYTEDQVKQLQQHSEDTALLVRQLRSYQYFIDLSLRKEKLEQCNPGSCKLYEGKVSLEKDIREMFEKQSPDPWSNPDEQTDTVDKWIEQHYVTLETSIPDILMYVEIKPGHEQIVKFTKRFMFCDREIKRLCKIFDGILGIK